MRIDIISGMAHPLPVASSSAMELCHYAKGLLALIWRDGYAYKKAGVLVGGIVPEAWPPTTTCAAIFG